MCQNFQIVGKLYIDEDKLVKSFLWGGSNCIVGLVLFLFLFYGEAWPNAKVLSFYNSIF